MMHVALGYCWFASAAGYHLERAFRDRGHIITYVGMARPERTGYEGTSAINRIVTSLPSKPNLYFWVDPAGPYFPPGIEDLEAPTACYLIDVHLGRWRPTAARFFDAVFVAQRDYVEAYRKMLGHDQVYWLPLAAAPDVHRRHDLLPLYDIGFVGNLAAAHRGTARARRLKLLSTRFHTNDFYRSYAPEEVGRVYSQSRIVFNTSIAGDVTMRIFEGTASRALVLTDSVANGLEELFKVGRELVTFADDEGLLDKIEHYLSHEDERISIAAAGQRRTMSEHTYAHRVDRVIQTMTGTELRHLAPMRTASTADRSAARQQVYTHLHMLDALLDEARASGAGPFRRMWMAAPCLARRLLR
jgi:hypothetical protein